VGFALAKASVRDASVTPTATATATATEAEAERRLWLRLRKGFKRNWSAQWKPMRITWTFKLMYCICILYT